ncbi:DoxX family protein [Cloacibacterium normanense]|uniref:DoxX family protein n=1 Tax=Cloacibacterium normanense TaxID=237258 RepID=UPI00391CE2B5
MKNYHNIIIIICVYFHSLLFTYAAISKLLEFENFQVQLAQSPLISAHAGFISYAIIIIELITAVLLSLLKTRRFGMYISLFLMISFTTYIYLILNYSDFIPCSCGGILEQLGWTEHLIFNLSSVFLLILAITYIEKQFKLLYTTISISLTVIISGSMVLVLFLNSEYIIKKENNFTRRFIPHPLSDEDTINLNTSSFYFAGNHGDTIFLGNRKAPLLLVTILPHFKTYKVDTLKISEYQHPFKKVELNIVYPYFSVADGSIPIIFEGKFPQLTAQKTKTKPLIFTKIKMTKPHQYIFKATLSKNKKAVLGTLNTQSDFIEIHQNILEAQIDGLFDTDGGINYDPKTQHMVYSYLYRNQYIVTDFQLKNKQTGNTIDTIKKANIKLHTSSNGVTKLASPPLEVNEFQTTYNYLLFNASGLKGKFESSSRWRNSKVIDVYHYKNKTYEYSFYIKNKNEKKARSILATQKYFYALIGNDIIRYQRRK